MMLSMCALWLLSGAGGALGVELAEHYGPLPSVVMYPAEAYDPKSLFGYSLLVRDGPRPEVVVGAPRARPGMSPRLLRSGALYHCALPAAAVSGRLTNDTQRVFCEQIPLNTEGNGHRNNSNIKPYTDEMWLGASVAGVDRVNGRLIACAPRWVNHQRLNETESRQLVNGMCYALPASDRPEDFQQLLPAVDRAKQTFRTADDVELPLAQYAETGLAAHISADGRNLLLGAPGYAGWIGGVIRYDVWGTADKVDHFKLLNMPNTYHNPPSTLASYGYFGYSVTSGAFAHDGGLLYAASAPRADVSQETEFAPSVLVFDFLPDDEAPLNVRAELFLPQMGSYFGAALLALDADADGLCDLLVAAPLYAERAAQTADAGRVYLYLNAPKEQADELEFVLSGEASGRGVSGSRFGYSLASLGDIDGDNFPEFAVGAPYEDSGVVYVYAARTMRLLQRVAPAARRGSARGFGVALARAPDLDSNGCDELAVGSLGDAALLRCRPTVEVRASIQLFGHNRVLVCIELPKSKLFPTAQIDLSVELGVSADERRVSVPDPRFVQQLNSSWFPAHCVERQLVLQSRANLTVELTMSVARVAEQDAAHALLADRSVLRATQKIVLETSRPKLDLKLVPLSSIPFVLGTGRKWSGELVVRNAGESAYEARVRLVVRGARVLRVPSACKMPDLAARADSSLDCNLITPLHNGQETRLSFDLDMSELQSGSTALHVSASALDDPSAPPATLLVPLHSRAFFNLTGWSTPKEARQQPGAAVALLHYFQVENEGPTQWRRVEVRMRVASTARVLRAPCNGSAAEETSEAHEVVGENQTDDTLLGGLQRCIIYNMSAGARAEFTLALETDHIVLDKLLNNFEEFEVITTAEVIPEGRNRTCGETSTLMLRADGVPLWAYLAAPLPALLLFAGLVYLLQRSGFFRRKERDELKKLRDQENANKNDEEIVTEEVQDILPD